VAVAVMENLVRQPSRSKSIELNKQQTTNSTRRDDSVNALAMYSQRWSEDTLYLLSLSRYPIYLPPSPKLPGRAYSRNSILQAS
jgi:hypothetical protein